VTAPAVVAAPFSAVWSFTRLIVATWAADAATVAALADAGNGVPAIYSARAPQRAPMPRIVTGYALGGEFRTFDGGGVDVEKHFDAFATGPGDDVVEPLLGAALDALRVGLEGAALPAPVGGWPAGVVAVRARNVTTAWVSTLVDPDGVTMHGVGRVTATLVPELA
jgi:hypothetical protein